MPDTKITALTAVSAAALEMPFPVVEDPGGTPVTKKATLTQVKALLFAADVALSGDISPSALSADTNDWSPTGLSTASVIRMSTDQRRKITGIAGGADGRVLVMCNVGSGLDSVAVLSNEDSASTAANRFAFPSGHDLILLPGDTAMLQYDATSSRWRCVAAQAADLQRHARYRHSVVTDCLNGSSLGEYAGNAVGNGSVTTPNAGLVDGNHPGVIRLRSGSNSNTGGRAQLSQDMILLTGGEVFECVLNPTTLASFTGRFGFHDATTSTDATDGAYIEVPSTGQAVLKTASNSSRTTSSTIATLSTATWYTLLIVVNKDATAVDAYIFDASGNQLGTQQNTANIPTSSGRECTSGVIATWSAAAATDLCHVDWIGTHFTRPLLR